MRSSLFLLVACASPAPVEPRAQRPATPRLTPDAALARIESVYRPGVQRCYQSRLKRDPAARGNVVVTFTVDEAGKLASAHAKGVHRSIEQCVERAMLRWSFPPPREEMTIRVALRLSSGS
jgi:outer membrane biosynthesis protein TonB